MKTVEINELTHVVVPREPTPAMREAALKQAAKVNPGRDEDHIKSVALDALGIYRAMLSSASTVPAGKEGALSCIFCGKPIAEGDAHLDNSGEAAHKSCAIDEFLAQLREERNRTAPFIKMCAEIVHPERSTSRAMHSDAVRAQAAFAILDNVKRQAQTLVASTPPVPETGE